MAEQPSRAVCVCGHVAVHHDQRKSVYAGLMADYQVIWGCGWNGCGCPRYVIDPDRKAGEVRG